MNSAIVIEQVKTYSQSLADDIRRLAVQIDNNFKPLSNDDVQNILNSSHCFIFVARDDKINQIVGMITLLMYRIPYTKKGILEDLVVDEQYRRQGIATQMIQKAIEKAKEEGVFSIDFTSRPTRESANNLYQKLGFEKRDTNVYRLQVC